MVIPMSVILKTDSYKASHVIGHPPGLSNFRASIEPRVGGRYPKTMFFGLEPRLRQLAERVTPAEVEGAEAFWKAHGEPFDRAAWDEIAYNLGGHLPLEVRAVHEGALLPEGHLPFVVQATRPGYAWLVTHVETVLSRVWYTSTVATRSFYCKKVLFDFLRRTSDGDPYADVLFKLQDFGARGVSCEEEARLGGMAHLVNFRGTDTIEGIEAAWDYYGPRGPMLGYSIPALEHSVVIAWGPDGEEACYRNFLIRCAEYGHKLVACVSDTYDFRNAVENIWCRPDMVQFVKDLGMKVVIRPDSGDAAEENVFAARTIARKVGHTTNKKGYNVLDPVYGLIQGDGNNNETDIERVLAALTVPQNNFSTEIILFGMGAGLLRKVDRDTQRFAYKPNAALIDGRWVSIAKNPKTDPTKRSKGGFVDELVGPGGDYVTVNENEAIAGSMLGRSVAELRAAGYVSAYITRFVDGQIHNTPSFSSIRDRAEQAFREETR